MNTNEEVVKSIFPKSLCKKIIVIGFPKFGIYADKNYGFISQFHSSEDDAWKDAVKIANFVFMEKIKS